MKKVLTVILALTLGLASVAAAAHSFYVFSAADGTTYDVFVVTKLNYGEDHKVISVTGHFERVVSSEETGDEPDTAPDSETTLNLSPEFEALMCEEPNVIDSLIKVTDLYQWFVDTHLGGTEELEGRELVFQCDLPDEEKIDGNWDFGALYTKIEVNPENEIVYMEALYMPWA